MSVRIVVEFVDHVLPARDRRGAIHATVMEVWHQFDELFKNVQHDPVLSEEKCFVTLLFPELQQGFDNLHLPRLGPAP